MITRFTQPSVNGRRSFFTGSLPATHAVVASVSAAALPQVTTPHSAPVSSAMRRLAPCINSSRLTNWRDACATAARTSGSIRLPLCAVRTLAQLMNGRTPSARYGLVLRVSAGTSFMDQIPSLGSVHRPFAAQRTDRAAEGIDRHVHLVVAVGG